MKKSIWSKWADHQDYSEMWLIEEGNIVWNLK